MGRPASVDPKGMARETVIPRQADMCPLASARKEDAMIRAALYARYSSDQQSSTSIADQQRICRERAAREGWQIEGAYEDAAISGASMILRPGIQRLLADAQAGKFDIVLAEALDRVSRGQADRSEEHTSELQSLMRRSDAVFCLKN